MNTPTPGLASETGSDKWFLRYTEDDSSEAHEEWNAFCGPHSLAAALGKTLAEIRPHMPHCKGWMSPTNIEAVLNSVGAKALRRRGLKTKILCNGINRIQWVGKWLDPGVPARVAYMHTHWVAHFDGWVLCTAIDPARLHRFDDWKSQVEEVYPWYATHYYELAKP